MLVSSRAEYTSSKKQDDNQSILQGRVMQFFKYYRINSYFEKAIRYDELYFSENRELNDPNDLKAYYFFEDDVNLWKELLCLPPQNNTWDIGCFLDVSDQSLQVSLNDLFKGIKFDSLEGSLFDEVDKIRAEILEVFKSNLKDNIENTKGREIYAECSSEQKAELCLQFLTALLARAVRFSFYSVSFSMSALNPMMWAHYADGFKGCVIIYRGHKGKYLPLVNNIRDKNYQVFEYAKVNYIDSDKMIPVLTCAISGSAQTQQAFLQKNSFWEYESEYRLFSVIETNPTQHTMTRERLRNPRARILHHHTNDILGVIFGPRCNRETMSRVDMTLMDNRRHCGNEPFYLFETELTRDGRVIISGAKKQCDPRAPGLTRSSGGMHQIIEGEQLDALLAEFNLR